MSWRNRDRAIRDATAPELKFCKEDANKASYAAGPDSNVDRYGGTSGV